MRFQPTGLVAYAVAGTVFAMLFASCGTSPMSPSNFVGTYTGTIVDSVVGAGMATITLTHVEPDPAGGTEAFGTWSTTFPDGSGTSGEVFGFVGNQTVEFGMFPVVSTNVPSTCANPMADVILTLSGNAMNGSYAFCQPYRIPNPETGTLTLMRH